MKRLLCRLRGHQMTWTAYEADPSQPFAGHDHCDRCGLQLTKLAPWYEAFIAEQRRVMSSWSDASESFGAGILAAAQADRAERDGFFRGWQQDAAA